MSHSENGSNANISAVRSREDGLSTQARREVMKTMTTVHHQVTHESLLLRLKDVHDGRAWDRFYNTYKGLILSYARRKGCTEQMAQDVLQETFITLTKKMPSFEYDRLKGKFRGFLLVIVKSRIVDAYRRENKHTKLGRIIPDGLPGMDLSECATSTNDWEAEWDREWENNLLLEALKKVKERVKPHIYNSFRMYVLEKRSADEVSRSLNIPKDNIYEHRRRLTELLQKEVALLRNEWGE